MVLLLLWMVMWSVRSVAKIQAAVTVVKVELRTLELLAMAGKMEVGTTVAAMMVLAVHVRQEHQEKST